jgi:putative transposase
MLLALSRAKPVRDSLPITEREIAIARVLRPLGTGPLQRSQAERAAQLLGLHWTTIYRLRARFLRDPRTSSLVADRGGRRAEPERLARLVEGVVTEVVSQWLPAQRFLAHPILDTHMEVRRRCNALGLKPPARNTVERRVQAHREAELMFLASRPGAQIAPGSFGAEHALEVVQIDHTQSDVTVLDRFTRKPIGRPWLTVAIDLATRTVPAFFVGMERPNAATVALLVSRIVQPKDAWLQHLGLSLDWPVFGIPKTLHLDNAAEFRSRALRTGCAQYGIELDYRPVGRPNYGGHIERLNRTLMQRLKGLPGATGNSTVDRKGRQPEESARLTLHEYEQWLALEIGQRYHNSEHRGLFGGTPMGAWQHSVQAREPRHLASGPEAAMQMLIHFMPLANRSIQADGLTLHHIRYWHPVFIVWREQGRRVRVRYHPEDLSRIFVSADGRNYVEAHYADLRRPAISLWERRAAVRALRANHDKRVSESLIFQAIGQQREIVRQARLKTARVRRGLDAEVPADSQRSARHHATEGQAPAVDYNKPVEPFNAEIWR